MRNRSIITIMMTTVTRKYEKVKNNLQLFRQYKQPYFLLAFYWKNRLQLDESFEKWDEWMKGSERGERKEMARGRVHEMGQKLIARVLSVLSDPLRHRHLCCCRHDLMPKHQGRVRLILSSDVVGIFFWSHAWCSCVFQSVPACRSRAQREWWIGSRDKCGLRPRKRQNEKKKQTNVKLRRGTLSKDC